ncbi:MAG: cysteine synthase A [Lentisphaeria bacterium]|nr:cysteine synthase A [Lentisphaeria bacterium]
MGKILNNVLESIGHTPLIRINKLVPPNVEILVKVESFNSGGSSKDRVGLNMIEEAEKAGLLKKGGLIVEPTSGNTGVGLALASAVKGYKLVLTMPDSMSVERRKLLAAYGAKLVLTPGAEGMKGAIAEAEKILKDHPGSFMPQQFANRANPAIHERTTAEEILEDTDGKVDCFISCVGTGGTLTGTAGKLKKVLPEIKIIAVEPADSPLLSGGQARPHKIQGIGANFIPEILDRTLIDEVMCITTEEAYDAARLLASKEGLLTGISSGAAMAAAMKKSSDPVMQNKRIVVLLPDTGERYLSGDLFNAE